MLNKILLKLFGVRIIYSQFGEDFIIESLIPKQKTGIYVDIGANHPIKFSNTLLFYKKGWRGINIEPNTSRIKLFNILRRRDTNLNIGIGEKESEMYFNIFKESTLSTFDQKAATEYKNMGHKLDKVVRVPVLPLSKVFDLHIKDKNIDIMSVDTEGFDMIVLKSNDWNKYRPRFIILETLEYRNDGNGKKLNDTYDEYMNNIGYKKIADTYINTIYEKTH